jgi:hypothetical protein
LEQIPVNIAREPVSSGRTIPGMSRETFEIAIWRRSLKLRTFGVITAIELLFASAYVSQLLGWVMLLVACVLIGAGVGSVGHASDSVGGLRQHRQ